jgi:RimJ/RimL family protein N-acetyltransferase
MLQRHPILKTRRLALRSFVADDALALQELAGAREIADTMISIPHPYSLATARSWIAAQAHSFGSGIEVHFALIEAERGALIGSAGLRDIDREHLQAELSFWIGRAWWARGFATEAAYAVLTHAFGDLRLNRIYAYHMVRNPQSGNVLRKIGMKQEGVLRQRVRKWKIFEDVVEMAVLAEDGAAV